MALQVWITGTDGMKNEGLGGSRNLGSSTSDSNGKIGVCLKITSDYVSDYTMTPDTSDITMCGWFKFNLAELQTALSSGYTSSATTPTGSLLGYNSYGGLGLQYETNNQYSSSGVINQINVFGAFRDANASATTIKTTIPFDTWTHISLTWNHIIKQAIIYINGVLINTVTRTSATSIGEKIFGINTGTVSGGNGPGKKITFYFNDIRCYDNLLSEDEIHELSLGKIGHWCLNNEEIEPTTNLGNINSNYSTFEEGEIYNAAGWGGDTGTVTYYKHGGYNDGPYKVYHKLTTGSGGISSKPSNDIVIESGKTYTMSIYVKSNRDFIDANHSFTINRGTDNRYIPASSPVHFTTNWTRVVRTFTATDDDAGVYGERSIVYNDAVDDYYVYFSCFQIEEKDHATPYVDGSRIGHCPDISGNHHDLTVNGNPTLSNDSARYDRSTLFDGSNYLSCTSPTAEAKTLSLWAYVESIPASAVLFADYKSKLALGFYSSGTHLITRCGGVNSTLGSTNLINLNSWNHFCVVNGETNLLYINGLAAAMSGSNNWTHSTNTLMIGRRSASSYGFTNKISDVRLYATALSADDVLKLYKLGNV